MHINLRRAIALFFLLIFAIGTPILLFYASGYRYNVKKNAVEKTGALVLETKPSRASILLNNESVNENTPARLKNIIPDKYNVKLEKEGYYTWEKDLEIKSQEATFAEDIILFKKAEPESIIDSEINWLSFSPTNAFAVFSTSDFDQDYLYLLDLNNQKFNLIYNNNKKFVNPQAIWSHDDLMLYFQSNGDQMIFPIQFPKNSFDLTKFFSVKEARNYKWNQQNNQNLFAQVDNSILELDITTKKFKNIFSINPTEKLIDFFIQNDDVYYIFNIGNKTFLGKATLEDNTLQKTLELRNDNYHFNGIYNDKIAIFDNKLSTIYLINQEIDNIYFQKDNIMNLDFHPEKNLLLLQTHQDLSYLDLNEGKANERNVTRYSTGLSQASWHNSTNYVINLQNKNINIIELDDRDHHFTISLPYENITNFNTNNDSEIVYFVQDDYLYSLEIK